MTNKTIIVTDRQLDIIKAGFGLLGLKVVSETLSGDNPELDGRTIEVQELQDLVNVLNNVTEQSVDPESAVTLTNAEKFLIGSAFGALLKDVSPEQESLVGDRVVAITMKLGLMNGVTAGAVEFLAESLAAQLADK